LEIAMLVCGGRRTYLKKVAINVVLIYTSVGWLLKTAPSPQWVSFRVSELAITVIKKNKYPALMYNHEYQKIKYTIIICNHGFHFIKKITA
jgi:hypothetical protein